MEREDNNKGVDSDGITENSDGSPLELACEDFEIFFHLGGDLESYPSNTPSSPTVFLLFGEIGDENIPP